ncbi:hypothetical protein M595_0164 [Lyngbya aestuarii BL J]|uniref:Uncharacterized protein n=1 Tax=Lyngbya aestuarii BL J TaxID=1348334 RepID=U7QQ27_9CYAN|nr:hypothetical protein M595_0164 [Lyngbya aestuarii BL J]
MGLSLLSRVTKVGKLLYNYFELSPQPFNSYLGVRVFSRVNFPGH